MVDNIVRWYIAVVSANTEKACEKKLRVLFRDSGLSFETYVPTQRELHEWKSTGKRKWIDRVLCSCYLFVRCTEKTRYTIKSHAPFILHFLRNRTKKEDNVREPDFAYIPDEQMEAFKQMVGDAEVPITIDSSRLHVGSKVRIKTGRLEGLEGYLYRDPKQSTRFCIKIDLLGYATMQIDAAMLELVE